MSFRLFTLTPNPALDLSGHVDRLTPNEKNYVHGPRVDPGGNGINSGRVACRLGVRPLLLGFAGGPAGERLRKLLDAEGLSHRFTRIRGSTRTNVTVTRDDNGQQTRLTFPGPRVTSAELRELRSSLSRLSPPGIALLGGSAPEGAGPLFYAEIARALQRQGLGVGVDVPAPLLTPLLRARQGRFLLLKPNRAELEQVSGRRLKDDRAIAKAAQALAARASLVCVSLAERGAIAAFHGRDWRLRAPRVETRGTVGAGDSMVGAIAARLVRSNLTTPEQIDRAEAGRILDALAWGIAAGAATASTEGTVLGNTALIRRLRAQVGIQGLF